MSERGDLLLDEKGNSVRLLGLTMDITEQHLAQQALRESEERFRRMSEVEAIAINEDGIIVATNEAMSVMFGFSIRKLVGMHVRDLVPPERKEGVLNHLELRSEAYETMELRKDGTTFVAKVHGKATTHQGRPARVTVIRDITERKRAERELQESEERLRRLSEGEATVIHDDGIILTANEAVAALFEYSISDLIGMRLEELAAPESRKLATDSVLSPVEFNYEFVGLKRDGARFPAEAQAKWVPFQGSMARLAVIRDLTERKRQEAKQRTLELKALARSKLATLGEVATGVAHEINQPLTYINTVNEALLEDLELKDLDPERMEQRLRESLRQVQRIDKIIQHLRIFGRSDDTELTPVSLEAIFENALLLFGERLQSRGIVIERQFDEGLPLVLGNENQLEQVLINPFQNAADAFPSMQKNAKISVSCTLDTKAAMARVSFSDNGAGIALENIERIFEPFFSTKAVGQGTGLGLSMAHGIILDHGGTIACESTLGKGTTLIIMLPVAEDHA